MKLFEVAGNDVGTIRSFLAVKQGEGAKVVPFAALKGYLENIGISTPDGLIAVKNEIDSAGDVIKDIDDSGNVHIRGSGDTADQDNPLDSQGGSMIDQMAKSGAKDAFK
jgi:hypothetical protein